MQRPFVSFVIPVFNRRRELETTLPTILAQRYPQERVEILVVDNSSQDDTAEWVAAFQQRHHAALRYVRRDPNGPGPARNLGARLACGELVAFLDSDVSLDSHWLERTVATLSERPEVGIVSGKLLYASHPAYVNSYGGAMSPIGIAWDLNEGIATALVTDRRECLWATCAAMLVRKELIDRVGGFDETYFYGYEESDLCWRANLAGARILCIPDALAYHRVPADIARSSPEIVFHYCKNRLRSLLKNYGLARLAAALPAYLLYSAVDLLVRRPRRAKLRALLWNASMLLDTLRARTRAQHTRTRTDADLAHLFTRRLFPQVRLANRRRRPLAVVGAGARPAHNESVPDDRLAAPPLPAGRPAGE